MSDTRQDLQHAEKLKALLENGLVNATYTRPDLVALTTQISIADSALSLWIPDLWNLWAEYLHRQGYSRAELSRQFDALRKQMSERFDLSAATIETNASLMRKWPIEKRPPGLRLEHYRRITEVQTGGDPEDQHRHRLDILQHAAEEGLTASEMVATAMATLEDSRSPAPNAEPRHWVHEWTQAHDIQAIIVGRNRITLQAIGGSRINITSETPITIHQENSEP